MVDDDWMTPPPIPNEMPEEELDSATKTAIEDNRPTDLEEYATTSNLVSNDKGVDAEEETIEDDEPEEEMEVACEESSTQQATCGLGAERALVMQEVLEKLDQVNWKIGELEQLFLQKIARTDYEVASLQRQTDEIERYRAGVYDKIMTPLLLGLVEVSDKMAATISFAQSNDKPDDAIGVKDLIVFKSMVDDMLDINGVRTYEPVLGERFESARARVLSRVFTGNRALHQTIAEVLSRGYELNGRAVLPATVRVYGYKAGYEDVRSQESTKKNEQESSRKE